MPRGQSNSTLSKEIIEELEEEWLKGTQNPGAEWLANFHVAFGVVGDAKKILAIKKWWQSVRYKARHGILKKKLVRKTTAGIRKGRAFKKTKDTKDTKNTKDTKDTKDAKETEETEETEEANKDINGIKDPAAIRSQSG